MKRSNKVFLSVIVGLFIALLILMVASRVYIGSGNSVGITEQLIANAKSFKKITGNGNIQTTTKSFSRFDSVNVGGQYDITLESAPQNTVTLTSDENILPYINMKLMGNVLSINTTPQVVVAPTQSQKLLIKTPTIHMVNIGGSTHITMSNITTDNLMLTMAGESEAYVSGTVKQLGIKLGGSSSLRIAITDGDSVTLNLGGNGNVNLTGKVKNLTIVAAGNVNVQAKELSADNVSITGTGNGNFTVRPLNSLSATAVGAVKVNYYGNPKQVNKTSIGDTAIQRVGD